MTVTVRIECQSCEAGEDIECDAVYVITLKDGHLGTIAHELNHWERVGVLVKVLELEQGAGHNDGHPSR